MLVGAPKAGTTSLYRYACQHPDLESHEQREMALFFSDDEYRHGTDAGIAKYYPHAEQGRAALAKHVFTMYSPDALQRLKRHHRDVHVVALLRDPVKRAYSSYWYARRRGWETATTFERAIDWELAEPNGGWLDKRDRMHLRVGVYHPHIQSLLDTFGSERVHVFLTDDLAENSARLCRQIFEAAGVDPGYVCDPAQTHNAAAAARSEYLARAVAGAFKSKGTIKRSIRNLIPHRVACWARKAVLRANEKPFTPPPMNPDTRDRLIEYFEPHNRALGEMIGTDLSMWSRA